MQTHPLTAKAQFNIGAIFFAMMALTRSHHLLDGIFLPDASWAIFFLAGALLASRAWLVALAVGATAIDFIAIGWGNIASNCVTLAYAMLYPTYAVLWWGGRIFQHMERQPSPLSLVSIGKRSLRTLGIIAIIAFFAEQISSGSFYFLSGTIANPTIGEYLMRESVYFPPMLLAMMGYVVLTLMTIAIYHAYPASPAQAMNQS